MTVEVATVPLALEDLLPVALAGVGAWLLAGVVGERVPRVRLPARTGAVLVVVAGLCKALWKLDLAVTGDDVAVVDDLLFAFLAPGFALLTWSLVVARGSALPLASPVMACLLAGVASLAVQATWPLLVVAVVGATATGVFALLLARSSGDGRAVVLFAVQLLLAFALVPFAGAGQSVAHQWWEQSLNTVGQSAFALGAWRLSMSSTVSSAVRSTA